MISIISSQRSKIRPVSALELAGGKRAITDGMRATRDVPECTRLRGIDALWSGLSLSTNVSQIWRTSPV